MSHSEKKNKKNYTKLIADRFVWPSNNRIRTDNVFYANVKNVYWHTRQIIIILTHIGIARA